MIRHLPGFAPLAEAYDGFVLDLWGVIHDGVRPLPGALDCLRQLRAGSGRSVLLSNAPRRASAVQHLLRSMGIEDGLCDGVVTSGEATHEALRDRTDPFFAGLGRKVLHLGPARDRPILDGLDVLCVDTAAAADFVLNTGPDDHRAPEPIEAFEPELLACRAAGLPMICANPDLEVIRGGVRILCAGTLALRYAELGGVVRMLGKPDPAIYVPVLRRLGLASARVLAVGDALRTDIAGAQAAGLDSAWVLGGIHGEALLADPAGAELAATALGLSPVAILPSFTW